MCGPNTCGSDNVLWLDTWNSHENSGAMTAGKVLDQLHGYHCLQSDCYMVTY
jgi:hypothetical protein